ncbi:MAG: histidinol-phosphate aminotransferase family protein [Ignavibacteria bacterium]|nr:histidinol-phosphate aminotransferase family protein [Ignavibacteria bacterium]
MAHSLIYLDRNESNYGPAPKCYDVLRTAGLESMSWYSREFGTGSKSILTARLAADLQIDESSIILGYGAEDLLKQSVQCFLTKDDTILIPSYSWWYYKQLAAEVGCKQAEYPLVIRENGYEYDIDSFLEIYSEVKPSMVFISSPNNPTGNAISPIELHEILHHLSESIVVLDEAYSSKSTNSMMKELLTKHPNLIIMRTFSKYYALAGIRIGYAVVGEKVKEFTKFTNRYLGYNRLSEQIAIAALDSPEYYEEIAEKMTQDKEMMYEEFSRLNGFTAYHSVANFILVKIPRSMYTSLDTYLKNRGFVVKFMNEELLNSHLRITLGTQKQNSNLMNAINDYCRENAHEQEIHRIFQPAYHEFRKENTHEAAL